MITRGTYPEARPANECGHAPVARRAASGEFVRRHADNRRRWRRSHSKRRTVDTSPRRSSDPPIAPLTVAALAIFFYIWHPASPLKRIADAEHRTITPNHCLKKGYFFSRTRYCNDLHDLHDPHDLLLSEEIAEPVCQSPGTSYFPLAFSRALSPCLEPYRQRGPFTMSVSSTPTHRTHLHRALAGTPLTHPCAAYRASSSRTSTSATRPAVRIGEVSRKRRPIAPLSPSPRLSLRPIGLMTSPRRLTGELSSSPWLQPADAARPPPT